MWVHERFEHARRTYTVGATLTAMLCHRLRHNGWTHKLHVLLYLYVCVDIYSAYIHRCQLYECSRISTRVTYPVNTYYTVYIGLRNILKMSRRHRSVGENSVGLKEKKNWFRRTCDMFSERHSDDPSIVRSTEPKTICVSKTIFLQVVDKIKLTLILDGKHL